MSAAPTLAGQSTGDGFMWIERRLPRLRQHRALGLASAAALVAVAIAIRVLLPELPPFLTFFPAVLLSASPAGSPCRRARSRIECAR